MENQRETWDMGVGSTSELVGLPAYVLRVEGGLRAVMQCDAHTETVDKTGKVRGTETGDWNRIGPES